MVNWLVRKLRWMEQKAHITKNTDASEEIEQAERMVDL